MDAAFPGQLRLRCIPDRIVCIRALKSGGRVDVGPFIMSVPEKRLPGPFGQRIESVVILALRAEIESEFAPGNQLIEEGFGVRADAPPAGTASCGAQSQASGRPSLSFRYFGEDLVRGNVSEVQIG